MGRRPLKHVDGPVTVPAAGTYDFFFTFPEHTDPYMIDLVAAQAQCGYACFCSLYLIQGGQTMMLERSQLTPDYPYMIYNHHFLMSVGDRLKCRFQGLATEDLVEWTVRGH